jgi:hypothetical protein
MHPPPAWEWDGEHLLSPARPGCTTSLIVGLHRKAAPPGYVLNLQPAYEPTPPATQNLVARLASGGRSTRVWTHKADSLWGGIVIQALKLRELGDG